MGQTVGMLVSVGMVGMVGWSSRCASGWLGSGRLDGRDDWEGREGHVTGWTVRMVGSVGVVEVMACVAGTVGAVGVLETAGIQDGGLMLEGRGTLGRHRNSHQPRHLVGRRKSHRRQPITFPETHTYPAYTPSQHGGLASKLDFARVS